MSMTLAIIASLLLTNVAETVKAVREVRDGRVFAFEANFLGLTNEFNTNSSAFAVSDDTGAMVIGRMLHRGFPAGISVGDRIRLSGRVFTDRRFNCTEAAAERIERLAAGTPPPVIDADAAKISTGAYDCRKISIEGVLRDTFRDEIDPRMYFFVIDSADTIVYAALYSEADISDWSRSLVNTRVRVMGFCRNDIPYSSLRHFLGRVVCLFGVSSIERRDQTGDAFNCPSLDDGSADVWNLQLKMQGFRRAVGNVLVLYRGNRLILRTEKGALVNVELAAVDTLPACGDAVEVAGYQGTDFYRHCLSSAIWRPLGRAGRGKISPEAKPEAVSITSLFRNESGQPQINPLCHGKLVTLQGVVRAEKNSPGSADFSLSEGDFSVTVDATGGPADVSVAVEGAVVRATGRLVVEGESLYSHTLFPHVRGITLAVNTPDGLVCVASPPWWTLTRFLLVVLSLVALLIAIIIWNGMLRLMLKRRSRQLLKEEVSRVGAEFRIGERTRLAVELHDALSQNLAAVAFQAAVINKAQSFSEVKERLAILERMLGTCRRELKLCLGDLRSDVLETADMTSALQLALSQVKGDAELHVRFPVPRSSVHDSTAQFVISVVRELVSNACEHGGARTIAVDGFLDKDALRFSVIDDGCGFDVENAPGISEGHFGLQGIRDRIRFYNGRMVISSDESGTTVRITVPR